MSKFTRFGNALYSGERSIDFVGRKWTWYAVSAVFLIASIVGLSVRGLNMGIEFVGGSEFQVATTATQSMADKLGNAAHDTGIAAATQPVVTTSGSNSVLVRTKPLTSDESIAIQNALAKTAGISPENVSETSIGPSWGQEVAKRSAMGLVVFLVLVVIFIWAYFRQWKMSVAAIVALAHDILITVGVYALSGFEVTPATVTGILTILGFSLYDTVVVFDKIRENTRNLRQARMTYAKAANLAVNQTLVRSINTSVVALIPVGALLYAGVVMLGSGSLKDLALALFVGMAVGAYSSIFIATPLLVQLKSNEKEVQLLEKRAIALRKADRYATVPSYSEGMAVADEPGDEPEETAGRPTPERPATGAGPRPAATDRGRVTPRPNGPVQNSRSAGRDQPSRKPKSQRGK